MLCGLWAIIAFPHCRTKMLISLVWIISFIICFPPLIGWSSDGVRSELDLHSGFVLTSDCSPQCILPKDPGYVLYSAIGSFVRSVLATGTTLTCHHLSVCSHDGHDLLQLADIQSGLQDHAGHQAGLHQGQK